MADLPLPDPCTGADLAALPQLLHAATPGCPDRRHALVTGPDGVSFQVVAGEAAR